MNILIAGASGMIGQSLLNHLSAEGHQLIALSRNPQNQTSAVNITWKKWHKEDFSDWRETLPGTDIIINLAGESIAAQRWTVKRKADLLSSRLDASTLLLKALKESGSKPKLFIQASAIGIYTPGQINISEKSDIGGNFLADLAVKWEQSSEELDDLQIPRVLLRIGLILSRESLLIKKFLLPFKLWLGGPVGNGRQMMSWIHIEDVLNVFSFIIKNVKKKSVYNVTAPNPVSMRGFCSAFGKAVYRPSWLPVPGFVLKVIFGREMAEETMLSGYTVLPINLQKENYLFKYQHIDEALNNLL